ncbi:MAG TPA: replication-associated recombination protein A [Bacilli bacterium]|nr:replication-associated recombination protein A [Bacilli bacterium]
MEPLAFRMRPKTFDDIVGQDHLVGQNGVIRKMVEKGKLFSLILYGDPGNGKTTIAEVVAQTSGYKSFKFNASIDNKDALKTIMHESRFHKASVVIIDEIHRMKKDIQDFLLPFVESGEIVMIGITTVNPYHSVNPAIRSRCHVLKLKSLEKQDLIAIAKRGISYINPSLTIDPDALEYLVSLANGEVRSVLNMIEVVILALEGTNITFDLAKSVLLRPSILIDGSSDNYFDTLSGLQKSIRGSDVDASLHYLAKLLAAEELIILTRRLIATAYEDIALANPSIGPRVIAACDAAIQLGMPEARLPLSVIVIEMALSPKSNSALIAVDKALSDIEAGKSGSLPLHLKNIYSFDESQSNYLYPHDYPGAWVNQQYLPDIIKHASYYDPKNTSKFEESLKARFEAIKQAKQEQNKKA